LPINENKSAATAINFTILALLSVFNDAGGQGRENLLKIFGGKVFGH
jgi:hypothetical protein